MGREQHTHTPRKNVFVRFSPSPHLPVVVVGDVVDTCVCGVGSWNLSSPRECCGASYGHSNKIVRFLEESRRCDVRGADDANNNVCAVVVVV